MREALLGSAVGRAVPKPQETGSFHSESCESNSEAPTRRQAVRKLQIPTIPIPVAAALRRLPGLKFYCQLIFEASKLLDSISIDRRSSNCAHLASLKEISTSHRQQLRTERPTKRAAVVGEKEGGERGLSAGGRKRARVA